MPYVDADKTLSDPAKVGRHFYLLEPFLPKDFDLARGNKSAKRLDQILKWSRDFSKNVHITAPLASYRILHKHFCRRLPELKDKYVIFMTGESADLSQSRPKWVCYDIFAERFRLSELQLRIINNLDKEYYKEKGKHAEKLEDIVLFPIAPFAFPAKVARDEKSHLYLKYPFPDIFEDVNRELENKGGKKVNPHYLEKHLHEAPFPRQDAQTVLEDYPDQFLLDCFEEFGKKGNYKFSTLLYSSKGCKRVFIDKKVMSLEEQRSKEIKFEHFTFFNSQLLGLAYSAIFDKLGKKEIDVFAKQTSYVWHPLNFAGGRYEFRDFGGVLRNAKMPVEGESHPAALAHFAGKVKYYLYYG
jgi:hypothetical protein